MGKIKTWWESAIKWLSEPMETPLIWTIKGNLPVCALTYSHRWIRNEHEIQFIETYTLDGEIVKQAVHVLALDGVSADIANVMGGQNHG